jgi:hypothetical protein
MTIDSTSKQTMETKTEEVNTAETEAVGLTSRQTMETKTVETNSMGARQLNSSQKEAMMKIIDFSGESNELDIDEWLFDLTNLFSLMK